MRELEVGVEESRGHKRIITRIMIPSGASQRHTLQPSKHGQMVVIHGRIAEVGAP